MATILGTNNSETLSGTANADLLQGLAGNDTLNAASGDDTLDGGMGNDSLVGGVGSDSYLFNLGDGADTLDDYNNTGVAETNVIKLGVGFSLADLSISQEGNGHMVIRFANSPLDSITLKYHFYYDPKRNMSKVIFADNSELDISSTSTAYTLNSTATVGGGTIDSNYMGTDIMMGDSGNDRFYSNAGNDLLKGNDGHDYLNGENGNDELWGGQGNDTLRGGEGDDVLNGEADNDEMSGQNGNDTLNGGSGNDTLYGGDGNDTLIGGAGIDVLDGGAGDDTYYVDSMHEYISDGVGNNTVVVGVNADNYYAYGEDVQNVVYESDDTLRLPYFIKATLQGDHSWAQWGTTGAQLTYSFVKSSEKDAVLALHSGSVVPNFQEYNDAQKANARSALEQFASFSGLTFTEIDDSVSAQIALIIGVDRSSAGVGPGNGQSLVKMRLGGANGYFVHAHELTHVIGLHHTFEGLSPLPVDEDSCDNSNVSYTDTPADLSPIRPIPMFDVATIQYLYGVNHNARAGNDVYTQNDRYIWDGAGIDTLSLTTAMQGVVADLRDGAWNYVGLKSESILADGQFYIGVDTDIENVIGSQWDDTLLGNELDNLINGGLGNNILDGRLGNDTAVCSGLWQNYTITGNVIAATVVGGEGTDTLFNIENICFNNVIVSIADAVNDNPIGVNDTNSGDVVVEASLVVEGDATASGNVLDNDTDADSNLGLGETKTVSAVAGQLANVGASILGIYGSVVINGDGSYLYTLNNNDSDTQALSTGQTVSDNFSYTVVDAHGATGTATLSISIAGTTDRILVESAVSYTLVVTEQDLTLIGTSNINGTGNALDNTLTGNSGNNILMGSLGNDTLDGGLGEDVLDGGVGDDVYYIDNIGDNVINEQLNGGMDSIFSSVNYSLSGRYVENLTLTGTSGFTATGNTLNNVLTGNSGNNTLIGASGNDTLDGGLGADVLDGGVGDDVYYVDNIGDNVTNESLTGGMDSIFSSVSYSLSGRYVESLMLTGSANLTAIGNSLNNVLTGNSGNNTLTGSSGNDTLDGGLGADVLDGGTGDDVYYVDNIGDNVTNESLTGGMDSIFSSVSYSLSGRYVENLTLTGTSDLTATGNTLNNVLTGNSGNNTLIGGAGNDTYIFGLNSGQDVVTDTFGATDVLSVLSGVAREQLWFTHSGNNLEVSIIGTTDKVTISNWYVGGASNYNQVEEVHTASGNVLLSSQVESLVSAMSSFSPPSVGTTTLDSGTYASVLSVIAANWS